MKGILGKKVGMTQIFAEDGKVSSGDGGQGWPVYVVVQRKTGDNDGYETRCSSGWWKDGPPRKVTKAHARPLRQGGCGADRGAWSSSGSLRTTRRKPGDEVKASVFAEDDYVDVVGTSRRARASRVSIKRHGFGGGRATHGSMFHRAPGSIGQASDPSRVFPGTRLPVRPGQAGHGQEPARRQGRRGEEPHLPPGCRARAATAGLFCARPSAAKRRGG